MQNLLIGAAAGLDLVSIEIGSGRFPLASTPLALPSRLTTPPFRAAPAARLADPRGGAAPREVLPLCVTPFRDFPGSEVRA